MWTWSWSRARSTWRTWRTCYKG